MKNLTETDIMNSLSKSMKTNTPNDFASIKNDIKRKERNMKKSFKWQWLTVGAMAAVVLIFGVFYYSNNYVTDSLIGIDVNPSIEIEVNKLNEVIKVNALNEGAVKIVDGMDLKKVDLNVALNALLGSMIKFGYLTGEDANILVSVQNDNVTKGEEVKNLVINAIDKSLTGSTVSANVLNQTITTSDEEIKKSADTSHISYGKAYFINELIKKDSSLDYNTLAGMSLREIAALVESKKVDISDIVEIDDDDSTIELIDDAIEDLNENKEVNENTSNYISKDKAKSLAYAHAGIKSSEVVKVVVRLDKDDNQAVYDVGFVTNNKKYEYEINATSGTVIDFETEVIKTPVSNTTNYISESAAKNIAYRHAGVNTGDVTLIKVVLDSDDGIKVYDIDFTANGYEYEYEINANNSSIMDFDKELID